MAEQKNLRVIFNKQANSVLTAIIETNGLTESDEDVLDSIEEGKEPKRTIVTSAAIAMARQTAPDKVLTNLLQKHLEISQEAAERIISDIKNKLLPLLLVYPNASFDNPAFREEIIKKIQGSEEEKPEVKTPVPSVKRVETKDVEKNAKILKQMREATVKKDTVGEELQTKKQEADKYREATE